MFPGRLQHRCIRQRPAAPAEFRYICAESVAQFAALPIGGGWIRSGTGREKIGLKKTRFRGFQLHYEHQEAMESMVRAADEMPSFAPITGEGDLIIDCGANIGVSVLEWKSRWPMAKVICFEPDPDAFRLLQLNVEKNDIPGVECIESAIADFDGETILYGETGSGADARGNSIRSEWGQREQSGRATVRCQRLSPFLARQRVAFLKLDIEGAEESVLREIAGQMDSIDSMYIEVHENDLLDQSNSLDRILQRLGEAGMIVEQEERFQPHALPQAWNEWANALNVRQTQLLCYRPD